MGIAIVTIVMIFESVILLAIATYKIIDAMVNKESAKEKEERLLEKLLQQSESTQRYVESFWNLLQDLLSEIQDEQKEEAYLVQQTGHREINEEHQDQTEILLQKLLERFEEFLLIWLRAEQLDHSLGSELYRDLICSKGKSQSHTPDR